MRAGIQKGINRVAIHEKPKLAVMDHLAVLGHRVEPASAQVRHDFLVDGRIRLAMRVAYPSASRRRVRVGDRYYRYMYKAWNFNFHHRGEVGDQYSDVFICVPLLPDQDVDLTQVFVIPWNSISGKTFYLPDSRRRYGGKFAVYRNAWHVLRSMAEAASGEEGNE